jgi:dTDP-4-dehydrorhamnose 3,5-epimerase
MTEQHTQLDHPQLILQKQFFDDRGKFLPTPTEPQWVQNNISTSKRGTFRGMHFQIGNFAQTKLVRVLSGSVIDVIVDLRNVPENKTYKHVFYYHLASYNYVNNHYTLMVPKGFAHGFLTLEDNTVFDYLVDEPYNPELDRSINYQSFPIIKELAERHGISSEELLISDKDLYAPSFEEWLEKGENPLPNF